MFNTFKTLWQFCSKRHNKLIKAFVFNFLRTCISVTQFIAIIVGINTVINHEDVTKNVIIICVLAVVCVLGSYVTSYFEQNNSNDAGFSMIADKRVSIGGFLRRLPLGTFSKSTTTKITATLTTNLSGMESASLMTMVSTVSGLFNCFCLVIFMFFYNIPVAVITLAGTLFYILVISLQIKVSRKNAPVLVKTQAELSDKALTYLKGIKVTKAFSFKESDKEINSAADKSCNENINLTNKSMPTQILASITVAIFESVIVINAIYNFVVLKNIPVTTFIVILIFSFFALASLSQAGSLLSMIGLLDSGLQEVKNVESLEPMETNKPESDPSDNLIEFNNVSFSYEENDNNETDKSEDSSEVLHNISLKIKPNTLTAIIGPSGSGKTTLCHLIPRFYDVTSGAITIGGVNIKNIPQDELMKKISMVFQNVYLFEDTILNNIRFGKPEATLEEVIEVSKKARCHDFISKLPQGYDTVLSEGGSSLSGGEKQRISIARAMLKDSPIVILDEATSALDAENEEEILKAIDSLIKGKTVIMIAHRIKTVQNAGKIIAVENGRIVQEGTHQELIKQDGLYKDFVEKRNIAAGWQINN